MDVSIIISTYNRKELLATCLRCLDAQDFPASAFEVIVVDDGSTDGSMEMVHSQSVRYSLRCITAGRQLGIGPARNFGVSQACGDIILFLDDDAFAPAWYLAEHVKTHREAAGPVYVSGPAIYVSGKAAIDEPPLTSPIIRLKAWLDFYGAPFLGANVSCPREHFLRLGGFDSLFGKAYGFQDGEMGVRFEQNGVLGLRNRRAYVLHHSSGTPTLELEMKKSRERGGTAAMFYVKYRLPSVKTAVHWGRLKWDERFDRWGWVAWATPERVAAMKQSGHSLYPLARKVLLTHLFASSLRQGLKDAGIPEQE